MQCRRAFRLEPRDLQYPEKGNVDNIDYSEGTLRFWYKPDYPPADAGKHTLFRSTACSLRGGLLLRNEPGSRLTVYTAYLKDGRVLGSDEATAVVQGGLAADEWVSIAVAWKVGESHRFYINGAEIESYELQELYAGAIQSDPTEGFNVGFCTKSNEDNSANGWIDEFQIWDQALPSGK